MLWLGADPRAKEACEKLKAVALSKPDLFPSGDIGRTAGDWPIVWSREFLSAPDLQKLDRLEIFQKLNERWEGFRDRSLPALRKSLSPGSS